MTIMENPSAFPMGEPNDGFAQYFVGQSYLAPVLDAPEISIHNVTFEPGCRNNWHIHHGGAAEATTRSKARSPGNSRQAKPCAFPPTPSTGMVRLRANPSPIWHSWFQQEIRTR